LADSSKNRRENSGVEAGIFVYTTAKAFKRRPPLIAEFLRIVNSEKFWLIDC
jgi:hypothetical protein